MSYQALYRVWRPTCLSDVVGQEHITKTLKNALIEEKLSHAYLFTGPRGTGKTSAAKIISKAINCEHAPVTEPCNECAACKGISDGTIVDVMEIDAASNNGVDEIRDIRDKVKFAPSAVKYKVYIIDEVHMLSTGAFNALLKTLEEPPKHVIFILATTEPHKIPLTIISRCQRFDFKRISAQAMIDRMREIIEASHVHVEEAALSLIARASEGGMRDALSLLDQAISYADESVTEDDVLSIIGAVSQQLLYDVALALNEGHVAGGLEAVDLIIKEGKDPNRFLEDLIFFYRDVLMFKAAPQLEESKERLLTDERFKEIVEKLEAAWIYNVMEQLNHFQQEMKWSNHPRVFLEMFIVKACQLKTPVNASSSTELDQNDTIKALLNRVTELESELKKIANGQVAAQADNTQTKEVARSRPKPLQSSGKSRAQISRAKGMLQKATKQHLQSIQGFWPQVMEQIKEQSVPASAWLNDCKPVACSEKEIVLSFKNEMHRDMIDNKFRDMVEKTLATFLNRSVTLIALLSTHWEETKDAFLKEQNQLDADNGEAPASNKEESPLIDEALKLVGEDLVEIKE
ncbi:DNA polymerase III subunit gamma/tau [Evansella cellulosilytica]|uniref:DNA-directed DNA polymerase n=1 Tax=Evansella cellulosilytica (strain ATCC 21833 / DSM 2522 / FERM P-1141 / JCM 9156 / N-4) TaxID=649639 RepID=E6TRM1_EVAC2|nr:DNA polymerase III subunit gamma/tau [Evansella cellulosilytica]ADU28315.1 DNA polymerase III, subunits gamma and tau [Evansella cellulosilytica DSM 2522]